MPWVKIPIQEQWANASDVNASGYVVKCYLPGTTTNTPMAIDQNGSTTVTTATLNADGFPEVSGNEVTLYIDRDFRFSVYENAADASSDTNAFYGPVDVYNVLPSAVSSFDDYAEVRALSSSSFADGEVITITDDGIAGQFVVKTGTVTDNGATKGTLIVFTDDSNRYAERMEIYADTYQNTNLGYQTGASLTTPTFDGHNTFVGYQAGNATTNSRDNTFVGYRAGKAYITDSVGNGFGGMTAIGSDALLAATDTYQCTAVGSNALLENTTGLFNQAFGYGSLQNVVATDQNTGCGLLTLGQYQYHIDGTAIGFFAGASANYTEGAVFVGLNAGLNAGNAATGYGSVNGGANGATCVGNEAGSSVLSGDNVTVVGSGALRKAGAVTKTGDNTTAIGAKSGQDTLVTVDNCTLLGANADVKNDTDDGQVVITSGNGRIRFYDDGSGNCHLTNSVDRGGGYNIGGFAESFVTVTATDSITIPVAVPAGARILGCQLRVDTALATGETWSAAYSGGSTQSIAGAGQLVASNTKINKMFDTNAATDVTTATTNIVITHDASPTSFTAQGLIRGQVFFQTFNDMEDV